MPLILNIDTSTDTASVAVTLDGKSLACHENDRQREHASFVHQAIFAALEEAGVKLQEIEAFAVTNGPGSYTGLRVGMATAKGLCYALNKPLITVSTLEVMTKAAIDMSGETKPDMLFCPLLDARRMEVFTALYTAKLKNISPVTALVLNKNSFNSYIAEQRIMFFGSGSYKFKKILTDADIFFAEVRFNAATLGVIADINFTEKEYANLSASEPVYAKEVFFAQKG